MFLWHVATTKPAIHRRLLIGEVIALVKLDSCSPEEVFCKATAGKKKNPHIKSS